MVNIRATLKIIFSSSGSQGTIAIPAKVFRSEVHHCMLSYMMHLGKAHKRLEDVERAVTEYEAFVRQNAILRVGIALTMKRKSNFGYGGVLVRVTQSRNNKEKLKMKFSFEECVKVSMYPICSTSAIAAIHKVSRSCVARVQKNLCFSYLVMQAMLFKWIELGLERYPPTFASVSTLWDETGERLVLPIHPDMSHSSQSSVWQVCLSGINDLAISV